MTGCVPIKLYLQKPMTTQILPMDHSLLKLQKRKFSLDFLSFCFLQCNVNLMNLEKLCWLDLFEMPSICFYFLENIILNHTKSVQNLQATNALLNVLFSGKFFITSYYSVNLCPQWWWKRGVQTEERSEDRGTKPINLEFHSWLRGEWTCGLGATFQFTMSCLLSWWDQKTGFTYLRIYSLLNLRDHLDKYTW